MSDMLSFAETCTFIINPSRYPGTAGRLYSFLQRWGIPHVIMTESRADFDKALDVFCRGGDRFAIVFGGDGTVNDALNALMEHKRRLPQGSKAEERTCSSSISEKALGFLRGGSGNGYHDSYLVPRTLRAQLRALAESMAQDRTLPVDLLTVEQEKRIRHGQLFGIGFDAKVLAQRASKFSPGFLTYVSSFIAAFCRLPNPINMESASFKMELFDGARICGGKKPGAEQTFQNAVLTTSAPLIEVGKRQYYGNRFVVCPEAVCNDGLLDICIFNYESKSSVIADIISLWRGRHERINRRHSGNALPRIEHYKARRLRITSNRPFDYHIDGELKSGVWETAHAYTVDISIVQDAIRLIVPEKFLVWNMRRAQRS